MPKARQWCFHKMIGRTLAVAALLACAGVPPADAKPFAASPKLLQQASIITPEGVEVDPNDTEKLKKYDHRRDLSALADTLKKEFGVTEAQLTQLNACTGTVVCKVPSADGKRIETYRASGTVALRPNILVTVKHAFQDLETGELLPTDSCRFQTWKNPDDEIAMVIDDPSQLPPKGASMSKTPEDRRRDVTVVRLGRPVEGCEPVSVLEEDTMLSEGDRVFQATGEQDGMLGEWSGREPVSQTGAIRNVFPAGPDGGLAYFSDLSGGEGGSGGGIFVVGNGQLMLAAIVQGAGRPEMNGKPYDPARYQNQTGLVGVNGNVLQPMLVMIPELSPSP